MNRRQLMATLGAAAGVAAVGQPATAAGDSDLPAFDRVERDKDWLDQQCHEHWGSRWGRPSSRGIHWLSLDTSGQVAREREGLLARVRVLLELDQPDYDRDGYDCEDFALALRTTLVDAWPALCVGVVFNRETQHVYNAIPTIEDGIVEIEPQNGDEVTDQGGQYELQNGVVLL